MFETTGQNYTPIEMYINFVTFSIRHIIIIHSDIFQLKREIEICVSVFETRNKRSSSG